MKDIKYETSNEEKMIKAIQKSIGAMANGVIGNDTLSCLAENLKCVIFPLTLTIYGCPTIISKDIMPFNPGNKALSYWINSIVGSFTYPRAKEPCSILINKQGVIHSYSCHAYKGYPEAVMMKSKSGNIYTKEIMFFDSFIDDVEWAVGGGGLLDFYNPEKQGFIGKDASPYMYDKHLVLGYKNGFMYGVFFKWADGKMMNDYCKNKFKFEQAILLDGGGLAAINGTEKFAQIGVKTKQGYAIQFV